MSVGESFQSERELYLFEPQKVRKNSSMEGLSCVGYESPRQLLSCISSIRQTSPDPETVMQWTESFLLCLRNKVGSRMFHRFLCSEFSEENLEFWLACEKFKKTANSKKIRVAHQIYQKFIVNGAPKEVNLSDRIRREIHSNLTTADRNLFDTAQLHIQLLMENDSYKRFVRGVLSRITENVEQGSHVVNLTSL